jgi:uncharacterized damage-inducible protein DinB
MAIDYFRDLARYQEWADAQFFSRWKRFPEAGKNEEIIKLANHLVIVQKLFINSLEDVAVAAPEKDSPLLPAEELRQICRENHQRLSRYLKDIDEDELTRPVRIPWFPSDFGLTVSDTILQMVLHTQHHRAQVLQGVGRYAEKSMVVDYIAWLYKKKPAGAWD